MREGLQSFSNIWSAIKLQFPDFVYIEGGAYTVTSAIDVCLS